MPRNFNNAIRRFLSSSCGGGGERDFGAAGFCVKETKTLVLGAEVQYSHHQGWIE